MPPAEASPALRARVDALVREGFVPFAFGATDNLATLDPTPLGIPLAMLPAEVPGAVRFHQLLLRLNARAFGGMGMPAWVQLDLGVLPSAFVGWALPADAAPEALRRQLDHDGDGLLPAAETLAVPTLVPGRVMSASMASLLPGRQLGVTAKLLGLTALRATAALGVTQYDNAALRSHTALGSLRVLQASLPMHSRPDTSFLYALELTDQPQPDPQAWLTPEAAPDFLRDHGGRIVSPGLLRTDAGPRVAWAP